MKIISAHELAGLAPYGDIIETLRAGFRSDIKTPVRHHHGISDSAILLLMPAWSDRWTGLKTVMLIPDNPSRGLPTIQANYLLFDSVTGTAVALLDGTELTQRRTAAASALAADYLAVKEASTMVLVGAGALGAHFVRAHASVRPITRVSIYSRTLAKSQALAKQLEAEGFSAEAVTDPESAIRRADIVSCVTTSTAPIVKGSWLRPGTHVDLAGAFGPGMRETDGDVIAASRVFVDTRDGALAEAGDLLAARAEGKFDFASIQGDLFELCRGQVGGRDSSDQITLFKSCGTAIEDLATAVMVYQKAA